MSAIKGIVEEVLEITEEYVIARCHQSVRFDRSTFDFKFTNNLDEIKEGYSWILFNNHGEKLKDNRTPEDDEMVKEFGERLNKAFADASAKSKLEWLALTPEEQAERKAKSEAFWKKIKENSYPIKEIKNMKELEALSSKESSNRRKK